MNFIRLTYSPLAQMFSATAIFALVLSNVYGVFPLNNVASATAPDKVTICHATESGDEDTIVYQTIVVSENAIGAHFENPGTPKSGHEDDLYFEGEVDCPGGDDEIPGCTDKSAINYDKDATEDDGSCEYEEDETGYLKVWKRVVGGEVSDYSVFGFTVNGETESFPNTGENYTIIELPVGEYDVVENAILGYVATYGEASYGNTEIADSDCTDIVVEDDEYSYCRITNTVDMCPNIDDAQMTVPEGKKLVDGQCVPDIPQCDADANGDWADSVVSSNQGDRLNETDVLITRSNPVDTLGEFDWESGDTDGFFSLGFGGSVTVKFDNYVPNVDGNDISIHEATNGSDYPEESAEIEVSQDGVMWKEIGTASNLNDVVTRVTYLDFDSTGWAWIKYVRVTDTSDKADFTGTYNDSNMPDGFDLDAVDATKTVCDKPGDEPQVCTIVLTSGVDGDDVGTDDDYTTVTEKGGAFAKLVTFIHGEWTAVIGSAKWVWGDDPVADPVGDTTQTFVRTFGWGGDSVTNATLEIASDNSHAYDLNATTGGTSDENNHALGTQDSYNVTGAILSGNNTLEIEVDNFAQVGGTTESNPAGLMYRLSIVGEGEDCDIPYEEEDDTTIIVKKVVEEGSDEETEFDFVLDDGEDVEPFASLAHYEVSDAQVVAPGTHTISEIGLPDWSLEGVQCSTDDGPFESVSFPEGIVTLELEEGDDVLCIFTNEEDDDEDPDPKVCRIGDNLIENGSFEDPAIDGDWTIVSSIPEWTALPSEFEIWNNFMGGASEGDQNLELDPNTPTTISQTVATVPGTVYELRFDFSARPDTAADDNTVLATADGNTVVNVPPTSPSGTTDWDEFSGTFVATDVATVIEFAVQDDVVASYGSLLDNVVLCVTDEVPLYTIDGFKWNDENGNGEWDDEEPTLSGWVIEVTNGEDTYATSTDANGYYWFEVPEGNWVVTEVQQAGWDQTYPDPEGQNEGACYVYFHEYEYPSFSQLSEVDDVSDDTIGGDVVADCNFGNHQDEDDDRELACEISASASEVDEGDDVTIYWSTVLADEATLNGNAVALAGSQVFEDMDEDTTFTLVATDLFGEDEGSTSVECSVTVEVDEDGGGSSSSGSRRRSSTSQNEPIGEVLGETTSVLPVGAPDTGAGGTSVPSALPLVAVLGMLAALATVRATKNG